MADSDFEAGRTGTKHAVGRVVEWTRKRVREAGESSSLGRGTAAVGRIAGERALRLVLHAAVQARALVEAVGAARGFARQVIETALEAVRRGRG